MAEYRELSQENREFVNRLFKASVKAVSPDDPTGHIPNCGYTNSSPTCGCSEFGVRLNQALVDEVASTCQS